MHQLTGLDASFLYLETPNAPMHISGLSIYDQSTAPGGAVRFKEIISNYDQRVRPIPAMTRRLVKVPFSLDHPYWVSDGTYDPEFHIRHIALPSPGDWRQLCILIARLHARPLDRARPLWEAYVIEGLDNVEGVPKGSFAIFSKTHHAAIDGASGMEMTAAIHDLTPDYKPAKSPVTVEVDSQPSNLELLLRAQLNSIKQPFRFISVARNSLPGFAAAYSRLRKGELHRVTHIPRTRFNGKVSPYRVFDAALFDLAEIKKIKNSVASATVNDVAITIVGGALRKYLSHHGELPGESLAAMAPVNVRSEKDGTGGNIVSSLTVQVRSDIDDPYERLQAVHKGTSEAKEFANAIGAKVMTDYTQFIPSTLTARAARLASSTGLAARIKPQYNCVITNVPGPQFPLYSTGAKMVANFGTGPVMDGMGLFHVIGSYNGDMSIAATCCRDMMPDPAFYKQCIVDSYRELVAAAQAGGGGERAQIAAKKIAPKRPRRKAAKKSGKTTSIAPQVVASN